MAVGVNPFENPAPRVRPQACHSCSGMPLEMPHDGIIWEAMMDSSDGKRAEPCGAPVVWRVLNTA